MLWTMTSADKAATLKEISDFVEHHSGKARLDREDLDGVWEHVAVVPERHGAAPASLLISDFEVVLTIGEMCRFEGDR